MKAFPVRVQEDPQLVLMRTMIPLTWFGAITGGALGAAHDIREYWFPLESLTK